MLRGRKDPGRLRKRQKIEPKRPTYLSRAKLLELDHDQLVGEIYMRMTPSQFETRCSHNKVHFVLSERHRSNPLWNNSAVISLLAKGPDFIPKPRPLATIIWEFAPEMYPNLSFTILNYPTLSLIARSLWDMKG